MLTRGLWLDQFVVDRFQAGAGTSHNMNTNEVLANRANELLGAGRGEYSPRPAPSNSLARLARTSLVFMLCEVPAPAWKRSTTNCSRQRPSARISSAAATIARPRRSS